MKKCNCCECCCGCVPIIEGKGGDSPDELPDE